MKTNPTRRRQKQGSLNKAEVKNTRREKHWENRWNIRTRRNSASNYHNFLSKRSLTLYFPLSIQLLKPVACPEVTQSLGSRRLINFSLSGESQTPTLLRTSSALHVWFSRSQDYIDSFGGTSLGLKCSLRQKTVLYKCILMLTKMLCLPKSSTLLM